VARKGCKHFNSQVSDMCTQAASGLPLTMSVGPYAEGTVHVDQVGCQRKGLSKVHLFELVPEVSGRIRERMSCKRMCFKFVSFLCP